MLDIRPNVPTVPFAAEQARLSDHMVSYWRQFAKKGDPNSTRMPAWLLYNAAADTILSLVPPNLVPKSDFALDHKCAFWAPGT